MVKIKKELHNMRIQAEKESIAYQGKMMGAIPWLLPFEWASGKDLIYQKGEGISLAEWIRTEKCEEEILDVLSAFFKNQKELEAYLIDEEKIMIDPEWIFWVKENKMLQLAYVPWDIPRGGRSSFAKCFAGLLWCAAVQQKWQNERLVLMLYRMQLAVKHQDQPGYWIQWIEQERKKLREPVLEKERALDILTEEEEETSIGWFRRIKNMFPFAIR